MHVQVFTVIVLEEEQQRQTSNCKLLHRFTCDCLYLKLRNSDKKSFVHIGFNKLPPEPIFWKSGSCQTAGHVEGHTIFPPSPSPLSHLFPLFILSSPVPVRPRWSANALSDNLISKGYLSKFSFSPKPTVFQLTVKVLFRDSTAYPSGI